MRLATTPVSDGLQLAISFGLLRVSFAVVSPIGGIGPAPFLVALSLVCSILRVSVYLISLPLCFSGSLTPRFLTKPLVSMSWTRRKIITTMTARDLIHTTHPYLVRIGKNSESKQIRLNERNYMEGKKRLWNNMGGSISKERNKTYNISKLTT
jgi:hypothetical protein